MGTGEESTPAKLLKAASSTQAYYGASGAPPTFFASTVASPPSHPYMWAGQPMMLPYGAYPSLYLNGGVYAHHAMPLTPGTAQPASDLEVKASDGKDRASSKKSKGNSGNSGDGGMVGDGGKVVSDSGNDGASQSADGIEDSIDASDENVNHQGLSASKKDSFNQMLAEAASAHNSIIQAKPVSAPGTNLNIGMNLCSTTPAGVGGVQVRLAGVSTAISPVFAGGRDGVLPDSNWIQVKVEKLKNENRDLKEEFRRLSEERVRLPTENASIKEELTRCCS